MSKRIQYALSLPALPTTPPEEDGRSLLYAKADGLYYRLDDGTEVGPLGVGSAPQLTEFVFPGTLSNFRLSVDLDGSLVTTPTGDPATLTPAGQSPDGVTQSNLVLAGSETNFRIGVDLDGALVTSPTTAEPGLG